jgi:hypothetical protein
MMLEQLKRAWYDRVLSHGLEGEKVTTNMRPLKPEEAIGRPMRNGTPRSSRPSFHRRTNGVSRATCGIEHAPCRYERCKSSLGGRHQRYLHTSRIG